MCVYLWAEETTFGAHDPALGAVDADQVRALEFAALNICVSACLDLESC